MFSPASALVSYRTLLPARTAFSRVKLPPSSRPSFTMQAAQTEEASLSDLYEAFIERQRETPKLTIPELARTMVQNSTMGALSVLSASKTSEGYPMGSIMQYVTDEDGKPILSSSDLSAHTKGMQRDGRISLMIPEDATMSIRDQRVTLIGKVEMIETDTDAMRTLYLKHFPDAFYVDFGDFRWYKMTEIVEARYAVVGGSLPRVGTVSGEDYLKADPDPMAPFSRRASRHMNDDHKKDVMVLAEANVGFEVDSAEIRRVDRLGVDIHCSKTQFGDFTCRVAFPSPALERPQLRHYMGVLCEEAYQKTGDKYLKTDGQ